MTDTIKEILSLGNMTKMAKKVSKSSTSGVDGMKPSEVIGYINKHHTEILSVILSGEYTPAPVLECRIPKADGRIRVLGIPTAIDRVIMGCLAKYMTELSDTQMSDHNYGFRSKRNCWQAVEKVAGYINAGNEWMIKVDLKNYFDTIDYDIALFLIRKIIKDETVVKLVKKYMKIELSQSGHLLKRTRGIPQGSAIAPVISNIILNEADHTMEKRGYSFVRYADDIMVLVKSQEAAHRIHDKIISILAKFKLSLNEEKTTILNARCGVNMLGFKVYISGNQTHIRPKDGKVELLREEIKASCRRSGSKDSCRLIDSLNSMIMGFMSYYAAAEIGNDTKGIDALIRRELKKYEKRCCVSIEWSLLESGHSLWRERHSRMMGQTRPHSLSCANGENRKQVSSVATDL